MLSGKFNIISYYICLLYGAVQISVVDVHGVVVRNFSSASRSQFHNNCSSSTLVADHVQSIADLTSAGANDVRDRGSVLLHAVG